MDFGDPFPSSSPLPAAAGLGLRQPQRQLSQRRGAAAAGPLSPRAGLGAPGAGLGVGVGGGGGSAGAAATTPTTPSVRDPRFKKASPRLPPAGKELGATPATATGAAGRWTSKLRVAAAKPLVPVTERRSQEENNPAKRGKKTDSDGEKWDITPDGGSAGREGRQFKVSNVGNNGRIYLRPTVRPANQRYPQPTFVFPLSPPGTAGLDAMAIGPPVEDDTSELQGSQWTATTSTPRPGLVATSRGPAQGPRHRRAQSDSTIRDASAMRETDDGAFKIVISKPGDELRPKTMEDIDPAHLPLLDIAIPTWKLGTPRFTTRGTAFFRGSSYAPTEDFPRSSNVSFLNRSQRDLTPSLPEPFPARSEFLPIPHIRLPSLDDQAPAQSMSPRLPPARLTYLSTHLVIRPEMFDALTFKPACDERSTVRYSPATGAVTAATPPRLVAEITSPTFLDYELISDFFLTYRAFLEPSDLLRMLIARLRWAVARNDETGMIVRVRTFVALRHWILNYFMDDFVVDYGLRVTFCNLVNDFVDELLQEPRAQKVQLKILAELKKCWRRVCAQYWDGPEFDASLGSNVPISPGGIAGHRNPGLDPTFWERDDEGPPRLDTSLSQAKPLDDISFYAEVSRAGHVTDLAVVSHRPETPEQRPAENRARRQQMSPTSVVSMEIVSCSFPGKNLRMAAAAAAAPYALGAHPVEASSVYSHGPVATTPKALMGKRVRPQHHTHKRNGSLTDSLREHATTEKVMIKDQEFLLTIPYAGSLVRGNLMPPGQPFVEVVEPSVAGESQRQTTILELLPADGSKERGTASAMSGQGMKKLLGSVRRALSTKGQGISPTQGNFINISPIGPRGATTNRLPGTAIVPQARPRQNGVRPPVRIDLLGAEIAEDFKKAVREDAAAEAERRGIVLPVPLPRRPIPGEFLEYSAAHMGSSIDEHMLRPSSDMAITTGSKSIVIVDDTMPFELPTMTGALPVVNPSVEAFADSFILNGADPTPPSTPPGHHFANTPRRSSYLLNQHVIHPSLSSEPLPPFIPDMDTLGQSVRASNDMSRPSMEYSQQSPNRPPLSAGSFRFHRRHGSSRTNQSLSSMMHHRRYASYHSGIVPQPTIRSFDATTYSEGASDNEDGESPVPEPLRVLRRRPGGDLRAATNVGELDAMPLHRSRSVGSLTTYSDSIRSSYLISPNRHSSGFVDVVTSDYSPGAAETFSLGAVANAPAKTNLSLFSTHSSKPIMRPSFEAEAQKLAQIPDDMDDDGGVESALLKLEGKYAQKKPVKLSFEPTNAPMVGVEQIGVALGDPELMEREKKEHRNLHVCDDGRLTHPPTSAMHTSFLTLPGRPPNTEVGSFLSEGSRESYSSIPLLDRGLTDDGRSKTGTREWANLSILQGPDDDESPAKTEVEFGLDEEDEQPNRAPSEHPSYDFVQRTASMERIKASETGPDTDSIQQSFLDDDSDDDDGTDLSSELSVEVVGSADLTENEAFVPVRRGTGKKIAIHPFGESVGPPPKMQPPSPPMTLVQALQMSPEMAHVPQVHEHQVWSQKPLPPTPDTTPAAAFIKAPESPSDPTGTKEALRGAPKLADPEMSRKFSVHLPFILAFDSDILAQQFTLIEKDALNEIDWKELIDMAWKNATKSDSRSWVDFLRNTDAHGVEVVIARFNIMVKWAISEIVLTQDAEERARCIIKYIHIAMHCRRYRNFATMSQIALALTSQEVSRLAATWAMVPAHDTRTFKDLEQLVSPTRNFYNLRAEMEGGGKAGSGAEAGCIPFVGIYTHDLLYNAQRPSEIASSPTTVPLVNFERCRCAAAVVKTLLRLLEASTLYEFQPIEGITERCLWMSALTDEEIRRHSESLE